MSGGGREAGRAEPTPRTRRPGRRGSRVVRAASAGRGHPTLPALLLVVLLVAATRGAAQEATLDVVIPPATPITVASAFPVTIRRVYPAGFEADPWPASPLPPLELVTESETRRADGATIREERHYRAFAFALGATTATAPSFAARNPSSGATLHSGPREVRFEVAGTLDVKAPGPVELPSELLPVELPGPPWGMIAGGVAGLALGTWWLARRLAHRRRRRPPVPRPPLEQALAALRAHRDGVRSPSFPPGPLPGLAAILREAVAAHLGLRQAAATGEEFLAGVAASSRLPAAAKATLATLLAAAERYDFSAETRRDAEGTQSLLDAVESFLRTLPSPSRIET